MQCRGEYLPREDLDVLFDMTRSGIRKAHDQLKEAFVNGIDAFIVTLS